MRGVVYTYFDRKFKVLAGEMLGVLEGTGQWVDDNLRDLAAGGNGKNKGGEVKKPKGGKKGGKGVEDGRVEEARKEARKEMEDEGSDKEGENPAKAVDYDDGGQFRNIAKGAGVFKRAENVSEAEDSGEGGEEGGVMEE